MVAALSKARDAAEGCGHGERSEVGEETGLDTDLSLQGVEAAEGVPGVNVAGFACGGDV